MPVVKAETITYNVCKSGCEYSDLNTVIESINRISEHKDVTIDITDSEDYIIEPQTCRGSGGEINENYSCVVIGNKYIDSFKISGHNQNISANLDVDYYGRRHVNMYPFKHFEAKDIKFNWDLNYIQGIGLGYTVFVLKKKNKN